MSCTHDKNDLCINLGLCCINNELRDQDIFCSRTMIRKNFTVEKAKELAEQNICDLLKILRWNGKNKIKHYRLTSNLFPHFTDDETEGYDINEFESLLEHAGKLSKKLNQRITTHPGQYNQIGTKSKHTLEKTVQDLKHHCDILDAMQLDNNAIVTIHGGGTYGDKENTIRRWIENFDDLPKNVKKRLTIENCEFQYNIKDCIEIAQECNIPVILDTHHFDCYNKKHDLEMDIDDYMEEVIETWKDRRMVTHISDQKEGAKLGAHHDYVKKIPECLLNIPRDYNIGVDIEVEAKAKEKAIKKLYDLYGELRYDPNNNVCEC